MSRKRMFVVLPLFLSVFLPAALGRAECHPGVRSPEAHNLAVHQGAYLGFEPPETTPELFAPNVVSTGREHSAAMFSPDGREIWFGRMFPVEILVMKRSDGFWSEPDALPLSREYGALYPTLTPDGNRLFFTSQMPVSPEEPALPRGQGLIWYIERTAAGWSNPIQFDVLSEPRALPSCVSMATNGNIYLGMRTLGEPSTSSDVYLVRFEGGRYLEPVRLDIISSSTPDHSPFVAPDESYLIWSSFRGGYGLSDLFISFRSPDGNWSEPRNLGPGINSSAKDEYPYVTPDGRFLFFNSNRVSTLNSSRIPDGPGNVFWVDATVLLEQNSPQTEDVSDSEIQSL